MKRILLFSIGCVMVNCAFTQSLFTYGANEVSKDEFLKAFHRNVKQTSNTEQSLKEYLDSYARYKLKVKFAKDIKLDTLDQFRYDLVNFRAQLENDFHFDKNEALKKTNFKRNPAVKNADLFRFADSVTLLPWDKTYPIEKESIFTMANTPVKVKEWLSFVKDYKLDYQKYKGEDYPTLLDSFFTVTVTTYYRKHLEDFNQDFKYRLQEFKEGNLVFELMDRNIWSKSANDLAALKSYYEANKQQFLWQASAEVIMINAKFEAYADYAKDGMKSGLEWRKIASTSDGMILADSGRYEISQLPLKKDTKLVEGEFTEIIKNNGDNGASFVKVIKIYPPNQQRSFEEAKNMVIYEYRKQLESAWVNDLAKKYPVKINNNVFQSLLK